MQATRCFVISMLTCDYLSFCQRLGRHHVRSGGLHVQLRSGGDNATLGQPQGAVGCVYFRLDTQDWTMANQFLLINVRIFAKKSQGISVIHPGHHSVNTAANGGSTVEAHNIRMLEFAPNAYFIVEFLGGGVSMTNITTIETSLLSLQPRND